MDLPVYQLTDLDRRFAAFIEGEAGGAFSLAGTAAALLSASVADGHVCLNLKDIAGRSLLIDGEKVILPDLQKLCDGLSLSPVVGAPGDYRPLILDAAGRLYLHRYWTYERNVARMVLQRAGAVLGGIDRKLLADGLKKLFPAIKEGAPDWQKIAAVAALAKKFVVISGGPGTGKTSTVVKIIALLLEQQKGEPLKIALAAPTGKSAMRLQESVRAMKEKLDCTDDVRAQIPDEVSTVHRLLGAFRGAARFRYSEKNLLPHDVVIIDEASMVALPLAGRLAAALRPDARLILIGDRNQLASVEAGAVLGDLCGGGRPEIFSPSFAGLAADLAGVEIEASGAADVSLPLIDSLVVLKKNYRFGASSGIGAAAQAVNDGLGKEALDIFRGKTRSDIAWHDVPAARGLGNALTDAAIEGYGPYLKTQSAAEALARFDDFRVLCALRQGPYGVEQLNGVIERILADGGLVDPRERWYRGRPVIITVNDYNMKLFNGDIGMTFPDPEAPQRMCVFFPAPEGGVRKVSPVRLPAHETAYAMTIHKSQGSEFDRIHIILPDGDSPVLTRELLYTGITRARHRVDLWGKEDIVMQTVSRRIERDSGLKDALWTIKPR